MKIFKSVFVLICVFILRSPFVYAEFTPRWFEPTDAFVQTVAVDKMVNAKITTPQGEVQVSINGVLQKFFKVEHLYNNTMFIAVEDYNFDGHLDLNIFYAYGYMGVNLFSKIYLFDTKTQKFNFAISGVNLERDELNQTLRGYEKSGSGSVQSVYKIAEGAIYLFETAHSVGDCLQEVQRYSPQEKWISTTLADPCESKDEIRAVLRRVKIEKAFLYNSPSEVAKSKSYLIQGDEVTVLEVEKGHEWLYIEFTGKKKIRKWLRADSVEVISVLPEDESQ